MALIERKLSVRLQKMPREECLAENGSFKIPMKLKSADTNIIRKKNASVNIVYCLVTFYSEIMLLKKKKKIK